MMLTLLWVLAQPARRRRGRLHLQRLGPRLHEASRQFHRLKRQRKPLRLKVNSHTGAAKPTSSATTTRTTWAAGSWTLMISRARTGAAPYSWRMTRARCCSGRLIWTSTHHYQDVAYVFVVPS